MEVLKTVTKKYVCDVFEHVFLNNKKYVIICLYVYKFSVNKSFIVDSCTEQLYVFFVCVRVRVHISSICDLVSASFVPL